tara:strand:- start:521 stop:1759 length:1239 start_codon:yes stop_codon:yes gene_type:complete
MADKKEIMSALRELKETRLLSSEVDKLMEPYVGATFDLRLDFVSAGRSFGSQKDPIYNDGQKVLCAAEKWDVECDILFTPDDNDLVESLEVGQDFQVTVRFIEYDVLYQRVIFGKVGTEMELLEEENDSSVDVSSDEVVVEENKVEETKDTSIEDKLEGNIDVPSLEDEVVEPNVEVVESTVEDVEVDSWKPESVTASEPVKVVKEEAISHIGKIKKEYASGDISPDELFFDVGMDEQPSNKIAAIAALRNVVSGLSLSDAKALIEDTPFVIKSKCTEEEAKQIQEKFRRTGAHVFYASSDIWDNIIDKKNTALANSAAPPLPEDVPVPTFGADDDSAWDTSYDESYSTATVEADSGEKKTNCGAGCVSLFFYCIGALTTLGSCSEGAAGGVLFGLIFIGIGYGVQKASGTK